MCNLSSRGLLLKDDCDGQVCDPFDLEQSSSLRLCWHSKIGSACNLDVFFLGQAKMLFSPYILLNKQKIQYFFIPIVAEPKK
jgi:hypothetical protein